MLIFIMQEIQGNIFKFRDILEFIDFFGIMGGKFYNFKVFLS